jgi:hypothetical protein
MHYNYIFEQILYNFQFPYNLSDKYKKMKNKKNQVH